MARIHKYSHRHAFKAKDSPNNLKCKHTQMYVLICFYIHVETHKSREFIDGYLKTRAIHRDTLRLTASTLACIYQWTIKLKEQNKERKVS